MRTGSDSWTFELQVDDHPDATLQENDSAEFLQCFVAPHLLWFWLVGLTVFRQNLCDRVGGGRGAALFGPLRPG